MMKLRRIEVSVCSIAFLRAPAHAIGGSLALHERRPPRVMTWNRGKQSNLDAPILAAAILLRLYRLSTRDLLLPPTSTDTAPV